MNQLKLDHEKEILTTQLEIQEQTFQTISREIHDNINLSLTLAKLNLNTLDFSNKRKLYNKVDASIKLLSYSIVDLNNISRGLNSTLVVQQGLVNAIENEIELINKTGVFITKYQLTGVPHYMEEEKELIIFRIIQEAFNNIIKHSNATLAKLNLHYHSDRLEITVQDNGIGFDIEEASNSLRAGLKNIQTRIKMLHGAFTVSSKPGHGSTLIFTVPI